MDKNKTTPEDYITTGTQITSADQLVIENEQKPTDGRVSERKVEEANLLLNPDIESMHSRG